MGYKEATTNEVPLDRNIYEIRTMVRSTSVGNIEVGTRWIYVTGGPWGYIIRWVYDYKLQDGTWACSDQLQVNLRLGMRMVANSKTVELDADPCAQSWNS